MMSVGNQSVPENLCTPIITLQSDDWLSSWKAYSLGHFSTHWTQQWHSCSQPLQSTSYWQTSLFVDLLWMEQRCQFHLGCRRSHWIIWMGVGVGLGPVERQWKERSIVPQQRWMVLVDSDELNVQWHATFSQWC